MKQYVHALFNPGQVTMEHPLWGALVALGGQGYALLRVVPVSQTESVAVFERET